MKRIAALIITLSIILSVPSGALYSDDAAVASHARQAVTLMYDLDVMRGDGNSFRPDDLLTREEMFRIMFSLTSVGGVMTDGENTLYAGKLAALASGLRDSGDIAYWAKSYAAYALEGGYFLGNGNGQLNPKGNLTYIECATVLLRLLGYKESDFHAGCTADECYWTSNAAILAQANGLFDGLPTVDTGARITRQNIALMISNALSAVHSTDAGARTLIELLFGIPSAASVEKRAILVSCDSNGKYTDINGKTYNFGSYGAGYSLLRREAMWVEAKEKDGSVKYTLAPHAVSEGWTEMTTVFSELKYLPSGTVYLYDNGGAAPVGKINPAQLLALDNNPYDVWTFRYKDGTVFCDRGLVTFRTYSGGAGYTGLSAEAGDTVAAVYDQLTGRYRVVGVAARTYADAGLGSAQYRIPTLRFTGGAELSAAIEAMRPAQDTSAVNSDTDGDGLPDKTIVTKKYLDTYAGYAVAAGEERIDSTLELAIPDGKYAVLWLASSPVIKVSGKVSADYTGYIGGTLVRFSDIALDSEADAVGRLGAFVKIERKAYAFDANLNRLYKTSVTLLDSGELLSDYGFIEQYIGVSGYSDRATFLSMKDGKNSGEKTINTAAESCPYENIYFIVPLQTRIAASGGEYSNGYFVYNGDLYIIPASRMTF